MPLYDQDEDEYWESSSTIGDIGCDVGFIYTKEGTWDVRLTECSDELVRDLVEFLGVEQVFMDSLEGLVGDE